MITDKNKREEIEATKRILSRIFLVSLMIFLLLLFFNLVPQFLLNNIAKFFINHNNYAKAEKCYRAILIYEYKIYKNINHTNPKWLNKLAEVYVQDKKYDLAILCYEQSISIYKSKKYVKIYLDKIINNLIRIGDIYSIKREPNNALIAYNNSLSYAKNHYGKDSFETRNIIKKINTLTTKR